MVDLTDASGYRLRLFFIYLFKWGDELHVRLKIRGAAAKLFVLWRRAANRTILVSLGAELGELVATLPRRVLSDSGK